MTATDPTYAALLAGVLATPEDDVPRLVLADWLEENGEPERAEFIRVQVELARTPALCERPIKLNQHRKTVCGKCQLCTLRRREAGLLKDAPGPLSNYSRWLGGDLWRTSGIRGWDYCRGFVEHFTCDLETFLGERCGLCGGTRERFHPGHRIGSGIVWPAHTNTCPTCHGTGRTPGIAPRLFASQPVTKVTLTDREPVYSEGSMGSDARWSRQVRNEDYSWSLPSTLFDLLPHRLARYVRDDYHEYESLKDSRLALNTALVAYGRTNAEGRSHEAVCESCGGDKRVPFPDLTRYLPGFGNAHMVECPDCDGTGAKPGLPPLNLTQKVTNA